MGLRSDRRKLSFDLLASESSGDGETFALRSSSDMVRVNSGEEFSISSPVKLHRRKKRTKVSKKKTNLQFACLSQSNGFIDLIDPIYEERLIVDSSSIDLKSSSEKSSGLCELELGYRRLNTQASVCETVTETEVSEITESLEKVDQNFYPSSVELRHRSVSGNANDKISDSIEPVQRIDEPVNSENMSRPSSSGQLRSVVVNGNVPLEIAKSLDWERLMAENSNFGGYADISSVRKLPLQYFIGEIYRGNSLRTTTSIGNEKNRQKVYNTMFHVPWRCELLIDVGLFVCLDSFLSLLTIMPARILMTFWRFRQFQRPGAAELSDFGCFVILGCGVALLQATDISFIYHFIRGQGTFKLYVVYNVLEIIDRLCQSFGGDVLQVLFSSAEGVASCSPKNMTFEVMRFILDQTIAVAAFIVHSFALLAQAITLSTCIVSHNNALLALLVSTNFAEIKSNVFKRFSRENLHNLAYYDTVERFHITAFLIFILAQNILEAEGPWFGSFITNAFLVYMCEIVIDLIKHSFLAKFNEIKPRAYSDFLEDLCKQTLDIDSDNGQKNLTFVPLAPACVVIRVLTPVYASRLPIGPLPWRLFWILLLSSITYIMLVMLKLLVGMGLNLHARWYIDRCSRRRRQLHLD